MDEKDTEKAARTYGVQVLDMPERVRAKERAARDASQALPREMWGTGTGVPG